jgi:hypothetical protein
MSDKFSIDEVNMLIDIMFEHSRNLDEIGFEDDDYLKMLECVWFKLIKIQGEIENG